MADDTRIGFLTPEQEQQLDGLIELSGLYEAFDGIAIRLADDQGLERLKEKIPAEVLPLVYEVIDSIFSVLTDLETEE